MGTHTPVYNRQETEAAMASNSAAPSGPQFGYTENGLGYLVGNTDSYLNAVNQEALWKREDLLREAGNQWDAHELDRIVEAAKRNNINPIFLLDALSGGTSASYTTSAAKANNYDSNAKTDSANAAKVFGALVAAIAMIVGAAL